MPLIKIEIEKGNNKAFLKSLMKIVMDSVQKILMLPADDRNIRLMDYERDFFSMKPPYKIIVEISMFSGRTIETKRLLYQTITEKLNELIGVNKDAIFILINEQPKENWGVRGGKPASEVDLGFKVEI